MEHCYGHNEEKKMSIITYSGYFYAVYCNVEYFGHEFTAYLHHPLGPVRSHFVFSCDLVVDRLLQDRIWAWLTLT